MDISRLPDDAFVRMRVLPDLTGKCRSTIYDDINHGKFPPPVKLGSRSSGWKLGDVRAWLRDPVGWKPDNGGQ